MRTIPVKKLFPGAKMPARATNNAVGYDVYAYHIQDKHTKEHAGDLPFVLGPGESVLVGIGIAFAVHFPIQCEVRPRSGLASRHDIELSNSPGTIDPDFRGEVGILLRHRGKEKPFIIEKGMRVAQLIFSRVEIPEFAEVEILLPSIRGTGGFGSTGLTEISEGTEAFERGRRKQDHFFMTIAVAASRQSECIRGMERGPDGQLLRDQHGFLIGGTRKFGCVIVIEKNIVSVGWNTPCPGLPYCPEEGCLRDKLGIPSGKQLEECSATHAEEMAILNAAFLGSGPIQGAAMYVNSFPRKNCAKLVIRAGIETIVVLRGVYPGDAEECLKKAGVDIRYVEL